MTPARKLDILVVDDDVDNCESLAMLLTLWGHDARISHDGRTALVEVAVQCPDVVFLDLEMPGMSGLELATRLKECPGPKPPLLVTVSGYGDVAMRVKVRDAGAALHLVKPADLGTMKAVLDLFAAGHPLGEPESLK